MPKKSDLGRAILDETAKTALNQMIADLKKEEACIRVSPSKLVSWIVEKYAKTGFVSDKDVIIKNFFDSKGYLKNMIRGAQSSDEIEAALRIALLKVGATEIPKRVIGRFKKKVHEPSANDALGIKVGPSLDTTKKA